ncbi:hypothetical protein, partial [Streptococcus dysgalactiae]|uniref:hypothetical protein n=1 Tax=Streptococcus dysgalactiae TaxID=1334 RepID=UPI00194EA421
TAPSPKKRFPLSPKNCPLKKSTSLAVFNAKALSMDHATHIPINAVMVGLLFRQNNTTRK